MAKEIYHAVGRRKSAVARVFLTKGTGKIMVNGQKLPDYVKRESLTLLVKQPLGITSTETKYDIKATVKGGGVSGQAGAIRLVKLLCNDPVACNRAESRGGGGGREGDCRASLAVTLTFVTASVSEAVSASVVGRDCFLAALVAMTVWRCHSA